MIEQFHSGAIETGWAFTIQSGAAVFVQLFFISILYRYFSEEHITKYGILVTILGFASIIITAHIIFIFIGVFLIGAGQALIKPAVLASLAKKEDLGQGMVMSLHGTYDSLGRSIGPILAGLLFALHPISPFLMSFLLCGLLWFVISLEHRKSLRVSIKKNEVGPFENFVE
jgi:MFS transporter, DHA1 family, multidrug resistance protein